MKKNRIRLQPSRKQVRCCYPASIQMLNWVIRDPTKRPLPAAAVRDRFKSAPVHSQGRRIFPRHSSDKALALYLASGRWRHRRTPWPTRKLQARRWETVAIATSTPYFRMANQLLHTIYTYTPRSQIICRFWFPCHKFNLIYRKYVQYLYLQIIY